MWLLQLKSLRIHQICWLYRLLQESVRLISVYFTYFTRVQYLTTPNSFSPHFVHCRRSSIELRTCSDSNFQIDSDPSLLLYGGVSKGNFGSTENIVVVVPLTSRDPVRIYFDIYSHWILLYNSYSMQNVYPLANHGSWLPFCCMQVTVLTLVRRVGVDFIQ